MTIPSDAAGAAPLDTAPAVPSGDLETDVVIIGSGPAGGAQRKSYVQAEPPASALATASRWAGTRNVRSVTACPTAAPGRGPAWPR